MLGNIKVSQFGDPLVVWQSPKAKTKYGSSSFYNCVEDKILSIQKKLSTISFLNDPKQPIYKSFHVLSDVAQRTCTIVHEILSATENFIEAVAYKIPSFENGLKLFKIVSIPTGIVGLVGSVYTSIYGKSAEKVDAALNIVGELASVIESSAVFCMGLQGIHVIAENVANWLAPVALVATIFSSVSILIHVRKYRKMQRLGQKLDNIADKTAKIGKTTLQEYRAFLKVLEKKIEKKPNFLQECFRFKDKLIAKRFIEIEFIAQQALASADKQVQQEGQDLLHTTMKTLRGRINQNMVSSVLAGVSATIGIIGSIVFFACPAVPAGLGISGVGAVIGAANFIYQRTSDYQVMQNIGLERKWYEWITC